MRRQFGGSAGYRLVGSQGQSELVKERLRTIELVL